MRLKLVTPPALEPVTTAEAKSHMRVDIGDDDGYIEDDLIPAARIYFEETAWRALITQTWRLNLDEWPESNEIELPRSPLQSVTSVVYKDADGTPATWPTSSYIVDTDSEPGRIVLADGESWPNVTLYPANPIVITFVAGYGNAASDVPAQMKRCIKLLIAHWYENREGTVGGTIIRDVPFAIDSLIWLNRAY